MIYRSFVNSKIIFFTSFQKFVSVLNQVQVTPSTILKKRIFSQYYNECAQQDKASVINILNFVRDKPKTGIAQNNLRNYLIRNYFKDVQQDPTINIQQLIQSGKNQKQQQNEKSSIELKQVQQLIQYLKDTKGKNSVNLKFSKIGQLISKMRSQQKKALLKIIIKKLRIGLTDKSFQFKQELQVDKNQPSQQNNQIKINLPNIQLMLAQPLKNLQSVFKFCANKEQQNLIADLKYDGERTLIIYKKNKGIQLMSRRRKQQTTVYKSLCQHLYKQLENVQQIKSIQIDGQIVCISDKNEPLNIQVLLNRRGKEESQQSSQKLIVYAFDVLEFNGEKYFNKQLAQRRSKIPTSLHIKMAQYLSFKYPEGKDQLLNYYKNALQRKYQGLIIKGSKDLYYTNGSRRHWGKFKKGCKIQDTDTGQIDLDLVVMGVSFGQGKKNSLFATYLLGAYHQGKVYPVSRVGSGFTDTQLQQFTKQFSEKVVAQKPKQYEIPDNLRVDYYLQPKYVFKVLCQDLTRSPLYNLSYQQDKGGISLRFPIFESMRQDKDPKDCKSQDLFQYIQKQNKR